jgi:hypothetical protein
MAAEEMPIFTRTFDFLTWLLPVTNNFPRAHRHTAIMRLLDAAFNLRKMIADYAGARLAFEVIKPSIQGWVNHARYANTIGLRKALLGGSIVPPPGRE